MSFTAYLIGSLVLFLLGLFATLLLHEWGHYIAARVLGIKVICVRVGFGKPLLRYRRRSDGSEWCLGPALIGGATQLLDERHQTVAEQDLPFTFNRQPGWRRLLIIVAGPAASLLVPVLVMAWLLAFGVIDAAPVIRTPYKNTTAALAGLQEGDRVTSVNGTTIQSWWQLEEEIFSAVTKGEGVAVNVIRKDGAPRAIASSFSEAKKLGLPRYLPQNLGLDRIRGDTDPTLGRVVGSGAAAAAGLQLGDHIVEANGQPVLSWKQLASVVENLPETQTTLRFMREGSQMEVTVTPSVRDYGFVKLGTLGVFPLHNLSAPVTSYHDRRIPLLHAVRGALLYAVGVPQVALENVMRLVGLGVPAGFPVGPIAATESIGDALHGGPLRAIALLCALSFAIGWFNLLPFRPLDGGQVLRILLDGLRAARRNCQKQGG